MGTEMSIVSEIYNHAEDVETKLYPQIEYGKKKFPGLKTYMGWVSNPIGIEIEVEGYKLIEPMLEKNFMFYWKTVKDGSLRDGIEFCSIPLISSGIDYALAEIEPYLAQSRVSHRTGIHVHNNVSRLTKEKLDLLFAYYILLEEEFFGFVDPFRKANPYCVPVIGLDVGIYPKKYFAFDMMESLNNYRTVEFRHMETTHDIRKIRRFLQLVTKLHRFIQINETKKLINILNSMEDQTEYEKLLDKIFGKTASFLRKTFCLDNLFSARFMAYTIAN
jgi:hypothetical protein